MFHKSLDQIKTGKKKSTLGYSSIKHGKNKIIIIEMNKKKPICVLLLLNSDLMVSNVCKNNTHSAIH